MLSRIHLPSYLSAAITILSVGLLGLLFMLINPNLREKARNWYSGNDRKILATLTSTLDGTDQRYRIFKIKEKGSLFLEFYAMNNLSNGNGNGNGNSTQSSQEFIQKIELPNPIDGYVTFMGEATNLAVANLDGDPLLEILVPSYNLEFAASLDIIKYNTALKKFELMSSFDLPENLLKNLQPGDR